MAGSSTIIRSLTKVNAVVRRHLANMPVPQSSRAQLFENHPIREGWETTMLVWYTSSLALIVAVLGFTPESGIDAWAQQEAQLRLNAAASHGSVVPFGEHLANRGEGERVLASSVDVVADETMAAWDKFSSRSMRWDVDDDDDEEEEEDDEEEPEEEEDNEALEDTVVSVVSVEEVSAPTTPSRWLRLWHRISSLFSALPEVQEEEPPSEEEEW